MHLWDHLLEADADDREKIRRGKAGEDDPVAARKVHLTHLKRRGLWVAPKDLWNQLVAATHKPLKKIGYYLSSHHPSGPPRGPQRLVNAKEPYHYDSAWLLIRDLAPDKVHGYGNKVIEANLHLLTEDGAVAENRYLFSVTEAVGNMWVSIADEYAIAKVIAPLLPGKPRKVTRRETLDIVNTGMYK